MTAPDAVSESAASREPQRRNGARIAAGIGGAIALSIVARYTLGGALFAPAGMVIASLFVRRRGGELSRGASWIAAVAGVGLALLALYGVAATFASPGTLSKIEQAADSADAQQPPPPAWIEKIAPGSTARAKAEHGAMRGPAMKWWLIIGAGFVTGMVATFVGTLGWLASLPLAYAVTGRWIGARPRDPPFVEAKT